MSQPNTLKATPSSPNQTTTKGPKPGPLQVNAASYFQLVREPPPRTPSPIPRTPSPIVREREIIRKRYIKDRSEQQSCLRCKTLGLRCSYSVDFDRTSSFPDFQLSRRRSTSAIPLDKDKFKGGKEGGRACCARCFRDGEVFCVAPDEVRGEGKVEYQREEEGWVVEGGSGILVREKIEELLGPKRGGRGFVPAVKEGEVGKVKGKLKPVFEGEGESFRMVEPAFRRKWRVEVRTDEEVEDPEKEE